jgi:hypothetical protein
VVARSAPSGAAELSGLDLPEDLALEAHGHVVAVADAVSAAVRARGGEVGKAFTEAHVYLRLLGRDLLDADDATLVEILTEELLNAGGTDDDGPDAASEPDDRGPDDGPGDDDDPSDDDPADECPADEDLGADDRGSEPCDDARPDAGSGGPARPPLAFRAAVAVRLELSTLLGLDRRPGEVPGYGVVAGSTARHVAQNRPGARIKVVLYDHEGRLEHVLHVRPPKNASTPRRRSRYRRQVLELTALTTTLDLLDPHDHLGLDATLLARAKAALAGMRSRPPEQHPARTTADAHRRHPGAELAAWIRARDRTCRFPGCTRPAMGADLDHTLDWAEDGLTLAENLGAFCEPHHLLKHDPDSCWTVIQTRPGTFVWTSPTGTCHRVDPEPQDQPLALTAPVDRPCSVPDIVFSPPPRPTPPWAPRPDKHGLLTDAARATAERLTRRAAPDEPPSRYDDDPDF